MSLSKKDYTAIAEIINNSADKKQIVRGLKRYFAHDNPLFRPDKFVRACGLDPYLDMSD